MMRKYIIFLFLVFFVLFSGLVRVAQLAYSSADEDLVAVSYLEQFSAQFDANLCALELVDSVEEDQVLTPNPVYLPDRACNSKEDLFRQIQQNGFTRNSLFTELDLPPPSLSIS